MQPGGQLTITTDVRTFRGLRTASWDRLDGRDEKQVTRFGTRFLMDEITECDLRTVHLR